MARSDSRDNCMPRGLDPVSKPFGGKLPGGCAALGLGPRGARIPTMTYPQSCRPNFAEWLTTHSIRRPAAGIRSVRPPTPPLRHFPVPAALASPPLLLQCPPPPHHPALAQFPTAAPPPTLPLIARRLSGGRLYCPAAAPPLGVGPRGARIPTMTCPRFCRPNLAESLTADSLRTGAQPASSMRQFWRMRGASGDWRGKSRS
jgi:hypothetical protein